MRTTNINVKEYESMVAEIKRLKSELEHSDNLNALLEAKLIRVDKSDEILKKMSERMGILDRIKRLKLTDNEILMNEEKLKVLLGDDLYGFPGEPTLTDLVDIFVYQTNKRNGGI